MSAESDMSAVTANILNSGTTHTFKPGERVHHAELGDGVVIAPPVNGFLKVFFPSGERQIPVAGLASAFSRSEGIVLNAKGGGKRTLRAWLCYQAHVLPLMENVSALTSAKIDLLPHQVVLTHRVATTSPRRRAARSSKPRPGSSIAKWVVAGLPVCRRRISCMNACERASISSSRTTWASRPRLSDRRLDVVSQAPM